MQNTFRTKHFLLPYVTICQEMWWNPGDFTHKKRNINQDFYCSLNCEWKFLGDFFLIISQLFFIAISFYGTEFITEQRIPAKHAALQLKQTNFFIFKATVGTCYSLHSRLLLLLECIKRLQRMVWKQFIVCFFPRFCGN